MKTKQKENLERHKNLVNDVRTTRRPALVDKTNLKISNRQKMAKTIRFGGTVTRSGRVVKNAPSKSPWKEDSTEKIKSGVNSSPKMKSNLIDSNKTLNETPKIGTKTRSSISNRTMSPKISSVLRRKSLTSKTTTKINKTPTNSSVITTKSQLSKSNTSKTKNKTEKLNITPKSASNSRTKSLASKTTRRINKSQTKTSVVTTKSQLSKSNTPKTEKLNITPKSASNSSTKSNPDKLKTTPDSKRIKTPVVSSTTPRRLRSTSKTRLKPPLTRNHPSNSDKPKPSTVLNKTPVTSSKTSKTPRSIFKTRAGRLVNRVPVPSPDDASFILLERNKRIEDLIQKKHNQNKKVDVYEFVYDPSEEPSPKRRKNRRISTDTSDESDNSMKIVIKQLRRRDKDKKVKKPKNRKAKGGMNKETKSSISNLNVNNEKDKLTNTEQNKKQNEEITRSVADVRPFASEGSKLNDCSRSITIVDVHTPSVLEVSRRPTTPPQIIIDTTSHELFRPESPDLNNVHTIDDEDSQDSIQDILDSFVEDDHIEFAPKTTTQSTPFRVNFTRVRNEHLFSVKPTSFTPSYDKTVIDYNTQERQSLMNSTTAKPIAEPIENEPQMRQTLLNEFIQTTKDFTVPKTQSFGIFGDISPESPKKSPVKENILTPHQSTENILGEKHSLNVNSSVESNLSGFSFLTDDGDDKENSPKVSFRDSKKLPSRFSFKKNKKAVVKSTQTVKQPENIVAAVEEKTVTVDASVQTVDSVEDINKPNEDVDTTAEKDSDLSCGLFEDVLEVSKKCTRTYRRKQPKRKRMVSETSNISDDDGATEPVHHHKRKKKDQFTKQEEEENNRLAAQYNSMFEEIAKYPLIIE